MSDLIDRDKLIDFIVESDPEWCVNPIRPIFDYIKEMPSAQQWVSVSEQFPEEDHEVLVYEATYKNIFTATLCGGEWELFAPHGGEYFADTAYGNITHWMPVPNFPEMPNEVDDGQG